MFALTIYYNRVLNPYYSCQYLRDEIQGVNTDRVADNSGRDNFEDEINIFFSFELKSLIETAKNEVANSILC